MLLLALDTSTPVVSVAVADGPRVLAELTVAGGNRHGELLPGLLAEVLRESGRERAELELIVAGVGPGPYTGLRVGVVTALVLARAIGIPAAGICSLDAIAARAQGATGDPQDLIVATDARRREIYWARYSGDVVRAEGPLVNAPGDIVSRFPAATWAGPGLHRYPQLAEGVHRIGPDHVPAAQLATLADAALARGDQPPCWSAAQHAVPGDQASDGSGAGPLPGSVLLPAYPLYLRRPDAKEPAHAGR